MNKAHLDEWSTFIQNIRAAAEALKVSAGEMPAVSCNVDRILANVAMLEINITDVKELV